MKKRRMNRNENLQEWKELLLFLYIKLVICLKLKIVNVINNTTVVKVPKSV